MNMQIQIGPNVHMRVTDGTAVDMSPTSHVKRKDKRNLLRYYRNLHKHLLWHKLAYLIMIA